MYKTALLYKEAIAEGTMRFDFQKPEGFSFIAGQSIDVFLIDPPETDAEGNKRAYSLCSAPHEEVLSIATRMRDTAFKRVLGTLPTGALVECDGPFGSFSLHENTARPAVFLAGGIGITPFRSMSLDWERRTLPHTIYLFYSNRRPEDAPFQEEMTRLSSEHDRFRFIPTMTNMEHSTMQWEGERGYIDATLLEKYVPRNTQPVYYLAGPQAMVVAMRTMLTSIGVSANDIRFEEFTGY